MTALALIAALIGVDFDHHAIVVYGDSITFSDASDVYQWYTDAGMAATSLRSDFAHALTNYGFFSVYVPRRDLVCSGNFVTCKDVLLSLYSVPTPKWLIVNLAEHFWESTAGLQTTEEIQAMLDQVNSVATTWGAAVICLNRWCNYAGPYDPSDDVYKSNQILEANCDAVVALDEISADPAAHGYGATAAVQWHPNDIGMARIAARIYAAMVATW